MTLGNWQLTPHLWPTVGAAVFIAIFGWLSGWQLNRAGEKRILLQQIQAGIKAPPVDLNAVIATGSPAAVARYRHVSVSGYYDGEHQVLATQITHNGSNGDYVLTPFHVQNSDWWVMVNRGWIPARPGRGASESEWADKRAAILAVPQGLQTINGLWNHLPRPGIRLGEPQLPAGWPKKMLYPTRKQLSGALGRTLLERSIWLSPDAQGGFVRDWHPRPRFGPKRHIGYAFQWMALGLTVFIVWFSLNLHRVRDDN